jgi:hypothetical protein
MKTSEAKQKLHVVLRTSASSFLNESTLLKYNVPYFYIVQPADNGTTGNEIFLHCR